MVYCGVLWCTVVYCGVLWCTVVYCGILWCTVVYCGILWCTIVYCGIQWYTMVYCGTLCGICTVLLLSTILHYRFLLGMFDPPSIQPYWNITVDQVNTAHHQVYTVIASFPAQNTMAPNTGNLLAQISSHINLFAAFFQHIVLQECRLLSVFGKIDLEEGGKASSRQVCD